MLGKKKNQKRGGFSTRNWEGVVWDHIKSLMKERRKVMGTGSILFLCQVKKRGVNTRVGQESAGD